MRAYSRNIAEYFRNIDEFLSRHLTPVVKWIMYICTLVYLLEVFGLGEGIVRYFGASPEGVFGRLFLWQPFTYIFVHDPTMFTHILFNLFGLWMFGQRLEEYWGSERFIRFVFFTAAGAVLTHLLFFVLLAHTVHIEVPIIGISGVIFGILVAYWVYWPDTVILAYFLVPMKTKYFVPIMILLEFLALPNQGVVARITHLAGALFGYVFIRYASVFDRIPVPFVRKRRWRDSRSRWRDF